MPELDSRVTALETALKQLAEQVTASFKHTDTVSIELKSSIFNIATRIESIQKEVMDRGKVTPSLIGTLVVVAGAVTGAIIFCIAAFVTPVANMVNINKTSIEVLRKDLSDHERIRAHPGMEIIFYDFKSATEQKFKEIETQFRAVCDVVNLETQSSERVSAILWNEIFTDELPLKRYFPLSSLGRDVK